MRFINAFIRLQWETASFLFGHYWHPMIIFDGGGFPLTPVFHGGAPIEIYADLPQIRFRKRWGQLMFQGAGAIQLDYQSPGPIGLSPTYQRDSLVPMLDGQLRWVKDDNNFVGVGVDYTRLLPRLVTNKNCKTREAINSPSFFAFAVGLFGDFHIASKVALLQNKPDTLALSGYAVTCVDLDTDKREYTNLRNAAAWVDMELRKQWSPGLFVGYSKNVGAPDQVIQSINTESTIYTLLNTFGANNDVDYAFRTSFRLRYNAAPIQLAMELTFMRVGYGTLEAINIVNDECKVTGCCPKGKVFDDVPVNLFRAAFAAYIFF